MRAELAEKTHKENLPPDYGTVVRLAGVGHLGFIERPADNLPRRTPPAGRGL